MNSPRLETLLLLLPARSAGTLGLAGAAADDPDSPPAHQAGKSHRLICKRCRL